MLEDSFSLEDKIHVGIGKVLNDSIKLTGQVISEVFGPDGKLKSRQVCKNTVTTLGKTHLMDQLASAPSETAMTLMAVGTGTGGTTALTAILGAYETISSRTHTANVLTYVGTFTGRTGTITEAGVFNSDVSKIMLIYTDTMIQLMTPVDSIVITWTFTAN